MAIGQRGDYPPSYCCTEQARTPRLNSTLKTSAAWMWLPAIAMVTSLGVTLPAPAEARQVQTIYSQNSTVYLSSAYPGENIFQIYGGTTISGGANAGIYGDNSQSSWTITNAGSVSGNPGIHLETSGTLANTGAITSSGATGVYLNAGGVVNNGDINHTGASITGYTYGVQIAGVAGTVSNFGTITGTGTLYNGGSITGAGVSLLAGGSITNYSGGTITGDIEGIFASNAAVTLTNSGVIAGTNASHSLFSVGVYLGAGGRITNETGASITGYYSGVVAAGPVTILNRGTIGSTGISGSPPYGPAGVRLFSSGSVTNYSGGLITGYNGIQAGLGVTITNYGTISGTATHGAGVTFFDYGTPFNNTLINTGTIIGNGGTAVQFGAGDDRLEVGTGASFIGAVDGGGGNNTLEFLADSHGTTSGYSHFQSVTLDTGSNWVFTNGATISGTLINNGTLTGYGTFGNSAPIYGAVLLTGPGTISNNGTIISPSGIGVYGDYASSHTLTNTGVITGSYLGVGLADGGFITNGDTLHTAALITGNSGIYIIGGAGTVINYGAISGTNTGVTLQSGGYVYNRGTASLIYGGVTGVTIANGGSVINYGTIIGGSGAAIEIGYGTISNYGTVNGSAGVIFDTGRSNTLTNQGVITGTTGAGVASGGTLAVINGGTNDGLATIGGATYGVSITGYGGVTNFGTITGTSYDGIHIGGSGYVFNRGTASLIQGGRMGVYIFGTGTVTNQGTIAGGTTSYGVYIRGGSGTVTNSAGASISGGWGGIHIEGGSSTSTVINYGTIASTSQSGTSGIGVVFADNFDGTLINGGTIIGTDGTAVQFGNGDDLLELLPGASFTGVVEGGSGNNTLAFGGSSPGYFSGLGSGSFVNFGTYAVYSGANWTFTGANTLDSGITLTNEGTVTTTGTFTNQGVINSVYGVFFNNGALINNNSITGLVRLGTGGSVANYGAMSSVYGGVSGVSIFNAGTISNFLYHGYHAIYLLGSGAITNSGTASLITGRYTIRANGALTLTNQGTITGSKDGVILAGGGSINNSGYIGATTYSSTAIDIIGSGNTTITNSGRISGSGYGIDIAGSGGATITNMGAGLISGGKGIYSNAGGSVAVTNYGTISGAGAGIVFVGTSNATVINSGTIIGTYGPGIEFAGRGNDTLVNSGAIIGNGGTAVQFGGGNNLLEIEAGASFGGAVEGGSGGVNTLEFLSGTIATTDFYNFQIIDVANGAGGAMNGYTTAQYITNHGSLVNGANLTISNTGTYSNGGTFTNASDGYFLNTGTASISIVSSSLLENDGLFNNQGTISVCNCSVFTNSGTLINSGTIAGDGSIGVVTLTGSGLIDNSGLIIANSGATAGVYVESGTITNRSGGTISDYYGIRIAPGGNATVTNAGTIAGSSRFYYGAGILLGSAATLNLTNQSGGVISGYYGIGIGTGGHATITNAGTITSTGGGNYGAGIAVRGGALNLTNRSGGVISGYDGIFVGRGSSATIVNAGSITGGNGAGIDGFGGTVMVTNQSGGVISGYSGISFKSGSVTVLNSGVIGGTGSYGTGIAAGRGLTVTNYAGGVIYGAVGIQGGTGSVITNMGTIASNGLGNPAILLSQGGTVFNSGTASVIVGGILIGNPTLANGGSVDNEGFIIGYEGVAIETGASDFVTNSGTIAGLATGVYLGSGGAVTNIGKSSYISSIGPGVLIGGGTGIVTNAGTIAGEFGVVFLDNGGTFNNTVVNSGTIIGNSGTSVQFGNGNNRLVVEAGYKFQGLVEGGSGANTFEVGSGSANFAAVGSEFIGFDDIQIDPGASLNLGTNPTIPAGFTIANTGSLSNSGTLTIDGVLNNSGGTFANTGVVIGATTGLSGGGDIVNSGTIIGSNGAGVDFTGPGSLNNTGLIIGSPFGLVAGAGDTIVNSGTIKDPGTAAVALGSGASLTNAAGQLISGVTGVQFTGTGASLTNLGTITGTGGIAIQFGAGSNTATLGTGSVLNGGIDGGGGAGQIVLAGTGTFSSVTNPLTNFGTGSGLTVASGANWGATGNLAIATVSNAGTLKPGSLTAPLKVSGNFAQTSSGTLQVALDASGAGSQLQVTGAASLAGSVAEIQSGTFTGPVKFTILTATGGVSGTFSSISGGTALLTPSLSYDANDVYVTIAQLSVAQKLATIGGTANEIAAATAFDAGRTANPASFLPALSGLDQLNSAGLTAALDKLDGENNADLSTAALIAGRQFVGLLQQHDLGSRGSDAKWTVWGSGFSQNGSLAGNGNAHQMAEVVAGGAAGVDYRASEALRIGAALGYGSGHFSVGGGNGTASIDYTEVALTGDYSGDVFYVNGVVGGTFGTGDSMRNVSLPGLSANAAGHPRNSQALGAIEAGYTVGEIETVSLTPFASMDVGSVDQHAFTETGAGTLNLGVAAKTLTAAQSILGTRASTDVTLGDLVLNTDFKLGWAHEFSTARRVTQSFAGSPSFTVAGASLPGDSAVVGVGVATTLDDGLSAYVHYDGAFAGGDSSSSFSAGIRFGW